MKKLLFGLCLLVACSATHAPATVTSVAIATPLPEATPAAYAGQLIYQIKDATHPFGCVLYKNVNFKAGQPVVQVMHGIGERGSGNLTDLKKPGTWGMFQTLYQAGDVFGFNVVIVQTANEYEKGEIPYGLQQALTTLMGDPNNIHLLAHSLGGFGLTKEVAKNAALAVPYATITITSSGPGVSGNSGKNLAASGRPIWLLTSALDSLSGTTYHVTDGLYADIAAAGGTVWETKYNTQNHNGVLSALLWPFNQAPNQGLPVITATATGLNNIKVSWYQWIMNNHIGSPVRSPQDPIIVAAPPVTIPTLPIIVHDTIIRNIPVPYAVHDTIRVAVHDTILQVPPVKLKGVYKIFTDGSVQVGDTTAIR